MRTHARSGANEMKGLGSEGEAISIKSIEIEGMAENVEADP